VSDGDRSAATGRQSVRLHGFGLTESISISTFLPHEWAATRADSVGFAAPHTDVAIGDVDRETGIGEILIRGQGVCAGYWNNPDATAQTFADHWLRTGDVGRVDEQGLVYVLDRIKDMINRGGENVYCVEVENCLIGAPGLSALNRCTSMSTSCPATPTELPSTSGQAGPD
jgi:long-chain acyl-CoA synthetase